MIEASMPSVWRQRRPNASHSIKPVSTAISEYFCGCHFRSKSKLRPFYSLVATITAEEPGHVELVSNGVAVRNNGPDDANDDGGLRRKSEAGMRK
jgi:Mn-containing catalase